MGDKPHCPSWSSSSGRDSSGSRLTAMNPNLIVFMILPRKGWSIGRTWQTSLEQWPSSRGYPQQPRRPSRLVAMVAMATIADRGTSSPPQMILPTFRPTVRLPSPKGPSSSLRNLVTLTLPLILIIIFPISMYESSSVPFLAVKIPGYMLEIV